MRLSRANIVELVICAAAIGAAFAFFPAEKTETKEVEPQDIALPEVAPQQSFGFEVLVDQPGLILLTHVSTGLCYLAPSHQSGYVETDPDLCAITRRRVKAYEEKMGK